MPKKILAVGVQLGSDDAEYCPFDANLSLLDWDIVLFRPDIESFLRYEYSNSQYQGKLCLNDTKSFRLREACAHWRREIIQAVESGKIVFVFLSEPTELFVATGTTSTSGTGRNQKVTRHVELMSNYAAIPVNTGWTATQGSSMALHPSESALLASYWRKFGSASKYNLVWDTDAKNACVTTQHGQKPVGMLIRSKSSTGALVLLPEPDFEREEFTDEDETEGEVWSQVGVQFASSLITEIVSLASAIASGSERTPEPDWAISDKFALPAEIKLRKDLLVAEAEVERAQRAKDHIVEQLSELGQLRRLLFEKGKALEASVISALRIVGFSASQCQDEKSEFDVVFESPEGRLLGEAEGKDNKPVNIDKLRQLSMNIHEDLQRDEVTNPAKGILFGDGYRLREPDDRPSQFTDKCVAAAAATSIGLIRTQQLYQAVKYLSETTDEGYARSCRLAMIKGVGLIDLPRAPLDGESELELAVATDHAS